MNFHHYASIENSYREKIVSECRRNWNSSDICVATEKIHGCNFSFITDGQSVKCAKRNSTIELLSSFHRSDILYEKYSEIVKQFFLHSQKRLREEYSIEITSLNLFGEICGGSYPGFKSSISAVQKEIYYSNSIEFIAFDLYVSTTSNNKTTKIIDETEVTKEEITKEQTLSQTTTKNGSFFVSYEVFQNLIDSFQYNSIRILRSPELAVGSLEEILELDVNSKLSRVPDLFGLHSVENNFIEGIVIRGFHKELVDNYNCRIL